MAITKAQGRARIKIMQLHRLLEFERVFTMYLEGKVTSEYVTIRAKKMLEIGLPEKLK